MSAALLATLAILLLTVDSNESEDRGRCTVRNGESIAVESDSARPFMVVPRRRRLRLARWVRARLCRACSRRDSQARRLHAMARLLTSLNGVVHSGQCHPRNS